LGRTLQRWVAVVVDITEVVALVVEALTEVEAVVVEDITEVVALVVEEYYRCGSGGGG
jgi:hypothetical protein